MKPDRNDPCPCGSGKKFKHCCLAAEATAAQTSGQFLWRRLRQELEGFPTRMLHFVSETYGPGAIDEAWHEFMLWDDEETAFDPDTPHLPVFGPWLFHAWSPNPDETDIEDASLHEMPPTQAYLQHKGARLSPLLREYLHSCLEQPFSFFEVERCQPGQGFSLRDLFTGDAFEVLERSGSETLQAGELIYARLASAQGIVLVEAMCPVPLPPIDRIEVVKLRQRMQKPDRRIGRDDLREWDIELRELYLGLSERLLYPQMPKLQITDGEDLEFHKLVFDIDSAQAAFDALKDLDILTSKAELLEQAERHADGTLRRVEITWAKAGNRVHTSWNNTVLCRIRIDGPSLIAETNSRERADAFRRLVDERLGDHARLRLDEVQSAERMLAEASEAGPDPAATAAMRMLENEPEVQALIAGQHERHYEEWTDTALPALDGRTPRRAVGDPDGREQVEALLRRFERDALRRPSPMDVAIFRRLRERLGLSGGP